VFRSVLEPSAAELAAASKKTTEQEQTLKTLLDDVIAAGMAPRMADAELHGFIAALSGCKALTDSIVNLQLTLNEQLMQVLPELGPAMDHSNEQHVQIVDAILSGDSGTARRVMYEHVEATRELITGFMR
jgi:GntR family transcriptional repressor for pyruvate dehydrogenase complex